MFGVILAAIGSFFDELANSIGKEKMRLKEESPYLMGFLTNFWGAFGFIVIGFLKNNFIFSLASLPTFLPRLVLEVVQAQVIVWAVAKSDRSTFGFIRTLTIPLLLLVDLTLGYHLGNMQIVGMGLVIITLLIAFNGGKLGRTGIGLVIFSAVNAVATISLYKYNITHFNSVEAEQLIVYAVLMAYFYFTTIFIGRQSPFRMLVKPIFLAQSSANGLASLMIAFAYEFAPASIILASVRSTAVFWTVVSGKFYFKESHLIRKLIILTLLTLGIILLVI